MASNSTAPTTHARRALGRIRAGGGAASGASLNGANPIFLKATMNLVTAATARQCKAHIARALQAAIREGGGGVRNVREVEPRSDGNVKRLCSSGDAAPMRRRGRN